MARKPPAPAKPAAPARTAAPAAVAASAKVAAAGPAPAEPPKSPLKISYEAQARAKETTRKANIEASFRAAQPMPGVLPKNTKMAMDSAMETAIGWAASSVYNLAFAEGYTFLGYAYLSELAQVPEYRLISEVISTEATRKWIKIQSISEDKAKADAISQLEEEFNRLNVREAFATVSMQDGFFGRAHLYLDTGDTDQRKELVTNLGDGDKLTLAKLKKGELRAIKTVEPVWAYPANYNANDPFADDWYRPEQWFVMAKQIHASRLLTFVGKPVPDLMKPAFSFGGLSMTQMAKPYVDNWLETRQSVNDLIQAFSTMVLSTDMSTILQGGNGDSFFDRIDLFNNTRNNRGVMALNKDSEDFNNVSVPLGSLDKLQAQAQEHMAAVSRIPLVKLLGITPSGLNASSDGEIRSFYDTIHAYQEKFFRPHLSTVFKMAQINLWGKVEPDLSFVFEPLWEMDEVQLAAKRKSDADTAGVYIDKGVLDPVEVRQAIAKDPASPYNGIVPEDAPVALEPEPGEIHETQKPEGEE